MRSVISILAGATVWAVLWTGGTSMLSGALGLEPATPITSAGVLLTLLALSVVLSGLAGWVTGAVAGRLAVAHALALGLLQLALGLVFQIQSWHLMPIWYHLPFLALLIPANVWGGWLRERQVGGLRTHVQAI